MARLLTICYEFPIERSTVNLTRREPGARQRDVLEAAAALFGRKGFAGTSTRELAAALGMQSASLYHHIGSKDDLLFRVCADSIARMRESTERAIASEDEAVARIRAVIEAHVRTSLADRDAHATMLSELRSLRPERRAEVVALRDEYEALVTETHRARLRRPASCAVTSPPAT